MKLTRMTLVLAGLATLLVAVPVVWAASSVSRSPYPYSGYIGSGYITGTRGTGGNPPGQSWYGTLENNIRTNQGAPGVSIGFIGRNYWNLSTVCGSTTTDYEGLTGAGNQPGNNYFANSPALLRGSCATGLNWYAYATAKHDFQSATGGAWNPITDWSMNLR